MEFEFLNHGVDWKHFNFVVFNFIQNKIFSGLDAHLMMKMNGLLNLMNDVLHIL